MLRNEGWKLERLTRPKPQLWFWIFIFKFKYTGVRTGRSTKSTSCDDPENWSVVDPLAKMVLVYKNAQFSQSTCMSCPVPGFSLIAGDPISIFITRSSTSAVSGDCRLLENVLIDRRCMASCHHDFTIILMLFSLYWHSTFPVKSFRILVQLELWCPCSVYVQLEFPVKSFQQNMLLDWGTNWYHYFTYQVLLFSTTEQAQHVFGSGLVNSILWDKWDRSHGQQHAFIVFGKNINLIFSLRGRNENEYARPGS